MDPFARALELASGAAGGVSPRPPVGAVVVDSNGRIVGEGATQPRPGPHAETLALDAAGEKARGGTLYATLEPHQFHGNAPPCTDRIIASGISRVVCPTVDPYELVNGKGFAKLEASGVKVSRDVPAEYATRSHALVEPFAKLKSSGMPLVTVKWGMSLDGCSATRTGDSKWISSKSWLQHSHRVRYGSDVVLTGIGTVLADDPALTARDLDTGERLKNRPRLRVVVDSKGRLPADARILRESGDVIQAVAVDGTPSPPNCETVILPCAARGDLRPKVELKNLLRVLGERGYANVLVDAGPTLTGELLCRRLVDKIIASVSTRIVIGGTRALHPVGGLGPKSIATSPRINNPRISQLGDDIVVEGHVEYPSMQSED